MNSSKSTWLFLLDGRSGGLGEGSMKDDESERRQVALSKTRREEPTGGEGVRRQAILPPPNP